MVLMTTGAYIFQLFLGGATIFSFVQYHRTIEKLEKTRGVYHVLI